MPVPAPTASGVIAADGTIEVDVAAGDYVLFRVTNEVQSLRVDATAGQFKLTFGEKTTADIAFNATAKAVEEALVALTSIGAGGVSVSGGPGDAGGTKPYVVNFIGKFTGTDVAALVTAAGTVPLTGGGAAATVTTTVGGSKGPTGEPRTVAFTVD